MKRLLAFFLLLIGAGIAFILLLPVFLSTDVVRNKVIDQLSMWTGREIVLTGPAEMSVFPNLAIELQGLSIGTTDKEGAPPLVAMDGVTARVNLLPLLSGDIVVDHFVLIRPRMDLLVDETGHRSWVTGQDADTSSKADGTADDTADDSPGGESDGGDTGISAPVRTFQIGLVDIRDGQIRYRDLTTGTEFKATAINTQINWPDMKQPLRAGGSLVWDGEVVAFDARIDDAVGLASGNSSQVRLDLESSPVKATLSGLASIAADLAMDGDLALNAPSLRALTRWAGTEIPPGPGFGALDLTTHFTAGGSKISLSETKLTLDGNAAEGAVTIRTEREPGYLQATLALTTLNLNPYLAPPSTEADANTGEAPPAISSGTWSSEPYDFSPLRFIDADLRISAGKIIAGDLDLGGGALTANLQQGRLATELVEIQAYNGHISGTIVVNARGQVPSMSAKLNASETRLAPLLEHLAGFTKLSGIGNVGLNLTASGASQKKILESLNGLVDAQVTNGRIIGIDTAKALRGYREKRLDTLLLGSGGETPFDFLEATFAIDRGVARNDNLMIQAPTFRVTGTGVVDIINRQLDYKLRAALVGPADNGDEATSAVLFEIPLLVKGPWSGPRVVPDAAQMIQDSTELNEAARNVEDALRQGDLDAARDAAEDALKQGESGVRSLLDGILGQSDDQ